MEKILTAAGLHLIGPDGTTGVVIKAGSNSSATMLIGKPDNGIVASVDDKGECLLTLSSAFGYCMLSLQTFQDGSAHIQVRDAENHKRFTMAVRKDTMAIILYDSQGTARQYIAVDPEGNPISGDSPPQS